MRTLGNQFGSVSLRYYHPLGKSDRSIVRVEHRCSLILASQWANRPTTLATKVIPPEENPTDRMARLEAAFFLAGEPLTTRKLAKLANLADGTEARTLIDRLSHHYNERGRAFQIACVAGGYQLYTRAQFSPWLKRQVPDAEELQISEPALETLAIVAYRQPVLRVEIEAVRGVQCGELLRQLMDRGLLRIVGRSEELGRPFLYGTSRTFLQLFGLRNLDELPNAERLQRPMPQAKCA